MFHLRPVCKLIGLLLDVVIVIDAADVFAAEPPPTAAVATPGAVQSGAAPALTETSLAVGCLSALEDAVANRATSLLAAGVALDKQRSPNPSSRSSGWTNCRVAAKDVCAKAARHEIAEADSVLAHGRTCIALDLGLTAAPAGIGAEIVRSIAQVVVTKAQAAGWQLLLDSIEKAAHCSEASSKFPKSCKVLSSLNIKDLLSAPGVLLDAVVSDVLNQIKNPVAGDALLASGSVLGVALLEATARWSQSGAPGLVQGMRKMIVDQMIEGVAPTCAKADTAVKKYAFIFGMCVIQGSLSQLDKCGVADLIKQCDGTQDQQAAERRLWDLTVAAFASNPKPIDMLNLAFALAQTQLDAIPNANKAAQDYLSGTKDLTEGLVSKDWVQATSGAVRVVETLGSSLGPDPESCESDEQKVAADAAKACNDAKAEDPESCDEKKAACVAVKERVRFKDGIKLLRLMAAVGNYALTFDNQNKNDPAAAAAAREKIITELVDRMVNRTDRRSGAVVSLGGALGLIGGPRFASTDKLRAQFAFPVQLTLGVGLQTYGNGTGGFHGNFSIVDLGQYVNVNDSGNLRVDTPDLKSSLALGLTLGGWLALRETPFYLGVHGSIAPFNQADGNQTFEVGLVTGIYVPLLDFN